MERVDRCGQTAEASGCRQGFCTRAVGALLGSSRAGGELVKGRAALAVTTSVPAGVQLCVGFPGLRAGTSPQDECCGHLDDPLVWSGKVTGELWEPQSGLEGLVPLKGLSVLLVSSCPGGL